MSDLDDTSKKQLLSIKPTRGAINSGRGFNPVIGGKYKNMALRLYMFLISDERIPRTGDRQSSKEVLRKSGITLTFPENNDLVYKAIDLNFSNSLSINYFKSSKSLIQQIFQ